MPGRPVHYRHEVEKPSRDRDIGDVRAPHVVRPGDREVAQQVGEDPVLRLATLVRGRRYTASIPMRRMSRRIRCRPAVTPSRHRWRIICRLP